MLTGTLLRKIKRRRRRRPKAWRAPPLTVEQILAWADDHRARTGCWPKVKGGRIPGADGTTWCAVDLALSNGLRGLPPGSSLARLLADHRGLRNPKGLPDYSVDQILDWSDRWHREFGKWPNRDSGAIHFAAGETWSAVNVALCNGRRGLPGGDSLTALLVRHRGIRSQGYRPRLQPEQILASADEYHRRNGKWPKRKSGAVPDLDGETWMKIDNALSRGCRGLPGGISLAQFLFQRRGVRNSYDLPSLSLPEILLWADAHHAAHGNWPNRNSGPIPGNPFDSWNTIAVALYTGSRGLPGRSSLSKLLENRPAPRPDPTA